MSVWIVCYFKPGNHINTGKMSTFYPRQMENLSEVFAVVVVFFILLLFDILWFLDCLIIPLLLGLRSGQRKGRWTVCFIMRLAGGGVCVDNKQDYLILLIICVGYRVILIIVIMFLISWESNLICPHHMQSYSPLYCTNKTTWVLTGSHLLMLAPPLQPPSHIAVLPSASM